jgi:hypothetical protein
MDIAPNKSSMFILEKRDNETIWEYTQW